MKNDNLTRETHFEILQDDGFADFVDLYNKDKVLAGKYYRILGKKPWRRERLTTTYATARGKLARKVVTVNMRRCGINRNGHLYRYQYREAEMTLDHVKKRAFLHSPKHGIQRIGLAGHHTWDNALPDRREVMDCLFGEGNLSDDVLEVLLALPKTSPTAVRKHKLYTLSAVAKHYFPCFSRKWTVDKFRRVPWEGTYSRTTIDMIEVHALLAQTRNPEYFTQHGVEGNAYFKATGVEVDIWIDTLRMAAQLGETVDLTWSPRRFTEEHDRMQREVNAVLLHGPDRPLGTHEEYPRINDEDLRLIDSTAELLVEANEMQHCVGSYGKKIASGDCAIYSVNRNGKRATLELTRITYSREEPFYIKQLAGRRNAEPDGNLRRYVERRVKALNRATQPAVPEARQESNGQYAMVFQGNDQDNRDLFGREPAELPF